jgi:hypothetical protein
MNSHWVNRESRKKQDMWLSLTTNITPFSLFSTSGSVQSNKKYIDLHSILTELNLMRLLLPMLELGVTLDNLPKRLSEIIRTLNLKLGPSLIMQDALNSMYKI